MLGGKIIQIIKSLKKDLKLYGLNERKKNHLNAGNVGNLVHWEAQSKVMNE